MLSVLFIRGVAAAQITFSVTTQTSFPAPACATGSSSTEQFTVNYNFETVERADPITGLIPIGVYNLLNFTNVEWVNTDPDLDGTHLGLAPHTYPDVATFGAGVDSLLSAKPVISVDYVESTVTSFTPRSWWYGCVLPSPYTVGSFPVTCTITATGLSKSGSVIATQEFAFKANGSVVQDQNYGAFKGFNQIHSLSLSVTNATYSAAIIDNFIATLQQQSCSPYYTGSYGNGT